MQLHSQYPTACWLIGHLEPKVVSSKCRITGHMILQPMMSLCTVGDYPPAACRVHWGTRAPGVSKQPPMPQTACCPDLIGHACQCSPENVAQGLSHQFLHNTWHNIMLLFLMYSKYPLPCFRKGSGLQLFGWGVRFKTAADSSTELEKSHAGQRRIFVVHTGKPWRFIYLRVHDGRNLSASAFCCSSGTLPHQHLKMSCRITTWLLLC